jgi:hypothetical protein
MKDPRLWLADALVRAAARRLRHRHPDWADAMIGEHASLGGHRDQLGWALGSLRASFALEDVFYPAGLLISVMAMTLYQWSADESLVTLLVLSGLGLTLGLLWPTRFLISGVAVGMVVAAVNSFETLSGFRPAYEIYHHTWTHDLRWLLLVLPALASSALGRRLALERPAWHRGPSDVEARPSCNAHDPGWGRYGPRGAAARLCFGKERAARHAGSLGLCGVRRR